MAIIYPRTMPIVGAVSTTFEPQQVDYMSPETGGRIGAVAAGFPLWRLRLNLTNMRVRDSDVWRSFISTLRGSRRQFLGFDPTRPVPRFHASGAPFGGPATSWAQAISADGDALLTLNGLMPGVVLSVGDYIGFRWDAAGAAAGTYGRRALVRAAEGGLVNGAGQITFTVEPPVPTVVPGGAVAHLDNPACLMRIVTGSTGLGSQVLGGYTAAGGTVEAVQDLLP